MQTITIDPNQGTVSVGINFLTPQVGTYRLQIFKPNGTDTLLDVNGSNQNTDNQTYELPAPPASNSGCLLWATTTVIDPQGAGNSYSIDMVVTQINTSTGLPSQIGTVSVNGTTTDTHTTNTLTAALA